MQNHNSVNTTGFVSLEQNRSGWRCNQCGCQNGWCSRCRQCGCAWPYSSGCVRGNKTCNADERAADVNVTCPHRACCDGDTANADSCQASAARETCASASARNTAACDSCPNEILPQYVQSCPDNTTLRSDGCNGCTSCDTCTASQRQRSCSCTSCGNAESDGCTSCDTCMASQRQGNCGCSTGASCQVRQGCSCQNGCSTASAATNAEKARNRAAGMVYAAKQTLDQVFNSESALRTGTLFPELHKPMNGYCPGDCNCSNPAQQAAFAAWELRLYLDTHPDDEQAQALFRQLSQETCEPNYATTFLPDDDLPNGWDWTQDPWPWSCRRCGE